MAFNVPYGYYISNLVIELQLAHSIKPLSYGILKQVAASTRSLVTKIKL